MEHGGALSEAAERHGVPLADWLDLSTGINPAGYPLPPVAEASWRRLPLAVDRDALEAAARRAYGVPAAASVVTAPGTQALIQWLPMLRPARHVAILGPTYGEHEARWTAAGARVSRVAALTDAPCREADVVVATNPNNPDGRIQEPRVLASLASAIAARDGLLIVDEAFCDLIPDASVIAATRSPGLCVLRSVGKFYGLAGIRVGFAVTDAGLGETLRDALGAWAVPGPAASVAAIALDDTPWAIDTRARLRREATALDGVLQRAGLTIVGGTALFRLVDSPEARAIAERLAEAGILVRRFAAAPTRLRFGLPPDSAARGRLAKALAGQAAVRAVR